MPTALQKSKFMPCRVCLIGDGQVVVGRGAGLRAGCSTACPDAPTATGVLCTSIAIRRGLVLLPPDCMSLRSELGRRCDIAFDALQNN